MCTTFLIRIYESNGYFWSASRAAFSVSAPHICCYRLNGKEWMTACAVAGLGTLTEVEGRPYDPIYSGLTLHDIDAMQKVVNASLNGARKSSHGDKDCSWYP